MQNQSDDDDDDNDRSEFSDPSIGAGIIIDNREGGGIGNARIPA